MIRQICPALSHLCRSTSWPCGFICYKITFQLRERSWRVLWTRPQFFELQSSDGKDAGVQADEARVLFDAIDTAALPGLRDHALIGLIVYTSARVGATALMRGRTFCLCRAPGLRHSSCRDYSSDALCGLWPVLFSPSPLTVRIVVVHSV
jgi:hypothetical protein